MLQSAPNSLRELFCCLQVKHHPRRSQTQKPQRSLWKGRGTYLFESIRFGADMLFTSTNQPRALLSQRQRWLLEVPLLRPSSRRSSRSEEWRCPGSRPDRSRRLRTRQPGDAAVLHVLRSRRTATFQSSRRRR